MRKKYCTVFESDKMSSVNAADIDLIELLVDKGTYINDVRF